MVRAKFHLFKVADLAWDSGAKELSFQASYDPKIPEDQQFSKATPTGVLTMTVNNPRALEQFKLGNFYYLDFTPAE